MINDCHFIHTETDGQQEKEHPVPSASWFEHRCMRFGEMGSE